MLAPWRPAHQGIADEGRRPSLGAAWRPWTIAAAVGLTALGALALHLMGRHVWCSCGSLSPWSWDIWSPHNSQHVLDPIGENTNAVIEAYRESTISLNYYGDSVVNSVGDVIAFALGYAGAMRLPAWLSALAFLIVEAALLLTIRDSLLLNIVMLLHPVAAIKTWQMGG